MTERDLHTSPTPRHARLFELLRQRELARKSARPAEDAEAAAKVGQPRSALGAIEALRDRALGSLARS